MIKQELIVNIGHAIKDLVHDTPITTNALIEQTAKFFKEDLPFIQKREKIITQVLLVY